MLPLPAHHLPYAPLHLLPHQGTLPHAHPNPPRALHILGRRRLVRPLRHRHHWNTTSDGFNRRVPPAVRQEATCGLVCQHLELRTEGDNEAPLLAPATELSRQLLCLVGPQHPNERLAGIAQSVAELVQLLLVEVGDGPVRREDDGAGLLLVKPRHARRRLGVGAREEVHAVCLVAWQAAVVEVERRQCRADGLRAPRRLQVIRFHWLQVTERVDEHVVGVLQPVELAQRGLGERRVPLGRRHERRHVVGAQLHGEPPAQRGPVRQWQGTAGAGRARRRLGRLWLRRRRPWLRIRRVATCN
uniref:Uncharacterized protein n=1 Tax=Zea mays TaxID=4577 RepID=C0PN66_MAIZE|nr:unknown [Zea mays]